MKKFVLVWIFISLTVGFNPRLSRLGVDYGPRKIGIASSNMFGFIQPVRTIKNTGNLTEVSLNIIMLSRKIVAKEIILGLPTDRAGDLTRVNNLSGQLALKFSRVLGATMARESLLVPLYLVDERYSTQEASIRQYRTNQGTLDAVSAACILERYIEDCGINKILSTPYSSPLTPEMETFDLSNLQSSKKRNRW